MLLLEFSSTLKALQFVAFSFLELQVYIFKVTQMLIGQGARILGVLFKVIASFWVNPLYLGEPRNNLLYQNLLQKLSIRQRHQQPVNFSGFYTC